MSAAKHTPGPWHVHDGDNRFLFVDSQTKGSVCKIAVNGHSEANARLIAAAPEMLELLKAMTPCPECKMRGIPGTQKFHWPNCENCIRAQALIDRIEK